MNLAPLRNGLAVLERSSEQYEKTLGRAMEGEVPGWRAHRCAAINAQLIGVERTLTLPDGLPGRPWYRNQIYAPGLYTGYGVKTLPGVRESIEEKQWKLAEEQACAWARCSKTPARKSSRQRQRSGRPRPKERHAGGQLKLGCRSFSAFLGLRRRLCCHPCMQERIDIEFLRAERADNQEEYWFCYRLRSHVRAASFVWADHSSRRFTRSARLLDKYCVMCHNDRAKTGGLTLEKSTLRTFPPTPRRGKW